MSKSRILIILSIGIFLLSSCCPPKTTIVLLPDPDGKVGHITVSNSGGEVEMTKASEATYISGKKTKPKSPTILAEEKIQGIFSQVLAILPQQPLHFILYFQKNSVLLTEASFHKIPEILESVTERESQDISVIGHTDTSGNKQYNLTLSAQRAVAVSEILSSNGIDSGVIGTTSHGEENPLIKTADNVQEPRNRRVEVVVR